MSRIQNSKLIQLLVLLAIATCAISAPQPQKPLTNDDVIAMVNRKLPESVIVSAIQSSSGKFNTSTNELIRLNAAGVTEKELNAMLASGKGTSAATSAGGAIPDQSAGAMPPSKSRM